MRELPHWCGRALTVALLVVVVGITLTASVAAVSAPPTTDGQIQTVNQTENSTATATDTATPTPTPAAQCDGQPQLASFDVVSIASRITPEEAGSIEANFLADRNMPADCDVIISLTYRLAGDGFQFTGVANRGPTATLLSTRFNVGPGEIRSISAQIKPNPEGAQVGDEVTVIASAELWYEGNREESRQISGIRKTLTVTEGTATPSPTPTATPSPTPSPTLTPTEQGMPSSADKATAPPRETSTGTPGFGVATGATALGIGIVSIRFLGFLGNNR